MCALNVCLVFANVFPFVDFFHLFCCSQQGTFDAFEASRTLSPGQGQGLKMFEACSKCIKVLLTKLGTSVVRCVKIHGKLHD